MKVLHVVAKRARPVPVLLKHDMTATMDVLVDRRSVCGVVGNEYFFAVPFTKAHLNFYTVLQNVAKAADLEHPELLTTTRMRKHVGSMAQV